MAQVVSSSPSKTRVYMYMVRKPLVKAPIWSINNLASSLSVFWFGKRKKNNYLVSLLGRCARVVWRWEVCVGRPTQPPRRRAPAAQGVCGGAGGSRFTCRGIAVELLTVSPRVRCHRRGASSSASSLGRVLGGVGAVGHVVGGSLVHGAFVAVAALAGPAGARAG